MKWAIRSGRDQSQTELPLVGGLFFASAGGFRCPHVADDAAENTKKKFRNMCTYYEVPLYFLSDKESLGRAMGKEFRASLAVQDENFAKAIMKELEKESGR